VARQKHHPKQATTAKQTAAAKQTAVTKQTAAAKKTASIPAATQQEAQGVAPGQRHQMIAEAAYVIAEQRGFQGDMALNDWLQAEAVVDARFAARH